MPYGIRKQGNRHCVYQKDTGKSVPGGCHKSREEAESHMKALYANVDDAKEKKSEGKEVKKSAKSYNSNDESRSSAKKGVNYKWRGR